MDNPDHEIDEAPTVTKDEFPVEYNCQDMRITRADMRNEQKLLRTRIYDNTISTFSILCVSQ